MEELSEGKTYAACLAGLQKSFSREILLTFLKHAATSLSAEVKAQLDGDQSFQKVCDLIHNQFQAASYMQDNYSSRHMMQQSEQKIESCLQFMKSFHGFDKFFVQDLLKRAKNCLKKSVETENAEMSLESLRELDETEWPSLDPKSFLFFSKLVFESKLVSETELALTAMTVFEAAIAYALIFRTKSDFSLCHDLIKQALVCLDYLHKNLSQIVEDDEQLTRFFSNKLLSAMTSNLDLSSSDITDRQKIVLEIVVKVIKLQE